MYITDANHNTNPKPQPQPPPPSTIDFSDDDGGGAGAGNHHHDMMIEVVPSSSAHGPTRILGPKKRAETWVQEETRILISLRREMDSLFNTSKSNKHLWEQISARMRERGFDRSPTMCTDKWRNLLKEFKKAKQQQGNGSATAKMSYYKEIEEILRERNRVAPVAAANANANANANAVATYKGADDHHDTNHSSKVDPFLQFSDKGIDDASIPFGPLEANERSTLNLERRLDHEGHPLAITAADGVTGGGVPPSFWRDAGNGDESHSCGGRVITVKWGDYTRRVGVDGSADAIKDAIRSVFGIRTCRAIWLEDENQIVRSLDRDMPLGSYTLHLDQGMTIKLCHYEESEHIPYPSQTISHAEEWTFYSQDEYRDFIHHRGWSCLRELNGYRNITNLDDLRPDVLYRGMT